MTTTTIWCQAWKSWIKIAANVHFCTLFGVFQALLGARQSDSTDRMKTYTITIACALLCAILLISMPARSFDFMYFNDDTGEPVGWEPGATIQHLYI